MKSKSHKNRGSAFEEQIELANQRYKKKGEAVIHKVPTKFIPLRDSLGKITSCKVEEKSCVDFIGRYQDKPIAFEAKHTASDKIELKAIKEHQADFLDMWNESEKGIAFVIVSFSMEKFFVVPWFFWKSALFARRNGLKNITSTFNGVEWIATGKASIKCDEMHPTWEVKSSGNFDYLSTVKRLFKV